MKTIINLILLLVVLATPTLGQRSKAEKLPNWNWQPIWRADDTGSLYYIDANALIRFDERVIYSVKIPDINGVSVVVLAVSNCIRGSVTLSPFYVIGKDGVPVKTNRPTTKAEADAMSLHLEPEEQGDFWKFVIPYACENAKH